MPTFDEPITIINKYIHANTHLRIYSILSHQKKTYETFHLRSSKVPSKPKAKKLFSSAIFVKVLTYCTANTLKPYADLTLGKRQVNLTYEEVRFSANFCNSEG